MYNEDVKISTIESFVISSNMKHIVTSHKDKSLVLWDVDYYKKKFKLVKVDKGEVLLHEFKDLLELSNDKILIYSCKNNSYIRDLNALKFSPITPIISQSETEKLSPPDEKKHLRFLSNDDLLLLSIPLEKHLKKGKEKESTKKRLNGEHILDWLYKEKSRLPIIFFQSLPLTPSIDVYSKDSLKNSKRSSYSYKIPTVGHLDLKLINVSRNGLDYNEKIFLALDYVILQLDTKIMKFERYYFIRNIKKEQLDDPENCNWMGAVNKEGNLLAICSTYQEEIHTYVFSMKNGILISSIDKSSDKSYENEYNEKHKKTRIQFLNINNADILMTHRYLGDKIEYTIMMPYDLSYSENEEFGEFQLHDQKSIGDYMIVETEFSTSSQLSLMFATGNQIKLIEFKIPIEKLYDKMNDHNLFIYSSYNVIKNGINNPNEKLSCEGKSLKWELKQRQDSKSLNVCKMDQKQNVEAICFHFEENCNIRFTHLQTLSNDDVVLYGSLDEETNRNKPKKERRIYIFGFNENKIILRYFYSNTADGFLDTNTLPNPSFRSAKISSESKIDMINELLRSRKYLVEMSEEIIDDATKEKKCGRKKIERLKACLDMLYKATGDVTNPEMNINICELITKYLPKLCLYLPTYYTSFISETALFPTPLINESYLSNKSKLVGYTYRAHTVQVYTCIESYVVQRIMIISRAFIRCLHYIFKKHKPRMRVIRFVVPYLGFTKYSSDYNFWMELLRPSDNPFVTLDDETIYDGWNAEALLNFKWDTFGWYYFYIFWGTFSILLLSFGIGTTLSPSIISNDTRRIFLYTSIVLGSIFIVHEIRQFIWKPKRYVKDIWNLFDLAAIIFPLCTAFFWLYDNNPSSELISISNLFLYFKFITYLRALDYFGSNLTIIVGVAKRIFSFLLILLIIIIGFAHAFFIILTSNHNLEVPVPDDDDPNDPNLFSTYPTSLLAMYLFLTGDSSSFRLWSYQENPFMTILLLMFSFLVVIYLMNLFIGLLNLEIEGNRTHFLFTLQKAKMMAEIELFLLLPNQRRWIHWFPDIIIYQMPIGDVQQKIMDIDNNQVSYHFTKISTKLRNLAEMEDVKSDPMSKTEFEVLITKFKDEIRILLNPDKNVQVLVENKPVIVVEK
ncbi:9470_t:CDS:2 [Funneliformis geosporum]|nr:9470_t:CDS:2 [Funneliformis geosporum]